MKISDIVDVALWRIILIIFSFGMSGLMIFNVWGFEFDWFVLFDCILGMFCFGVGVNLTISFVKFCKKDCRDYFEEEGA